MWYLKTIASYDSDVKCFSHAGNCAKKPFLSQYYHLLYVVNGQLNFFL